MQLKFHSLIIGLALVVPPADSPIRLPEQKPAPVPAPAPAAVTTLPADRVFPVECDVPCLLLASPAGLVAVSEQAGPVVVFGKFAGGGDAPEVRVLKGKQVFLVTGVRPGLVELLIVPVGEKTKESDVVRRTVMVETGNGPRPPTPDPKVDPKPPAPDPVVVRPDAPDGVTRVLVVYDPDTLSAQTEKRKAILYGGASHDFLNAVTPPGPDGKTREWRVYPDDARFSTPGSAWEKLLARPRKLANGNTSDWWVVVTRGGKIVLEAELPADPDGFVELVKPALGVK